MKIRKIKQLINHIPFSDTKPKACFNFLKTGTIIRVKDEGELFAVDVCIGGVPLDSVLEDIIINQEEGAIYAEFFVSHPSFEEGEHDFACTYRRSVFLKKDIK